MTHHKNKTRKAQQPTRNQNLQKTNGTPNDTTKHLQKNIRRNKPKTTARILERSRKLVSAKTMNPRLAKITFHTFRHWKATMEYHKTKDILHVTRLLGHKNIKNTLVYTQLVDLNEQDYISKVAWTLDEACKLIESGFQYVCDFENAKVFRKPK